MQGSPSPSKKTKWKEAKPLNGVEVVEILSDSSDAEETDTLPKSPEASGAKKRKINEVPSLQVVVCGNARKVRKITSQAEDEEAVPRREPEDSDFYFNRDFAEEACTATTSQIPQTDESPRRDNSYWETPRSTTSTTTTRQGPSYYLHNFFLILDVVLANNVHLFNEDESAVLRAFRSDLSEDAQRLYIRLFQRKGPWFRTHRLKYPEIDDLGGAMQELHLNGFCSGLRQLQNEDLSEELLGTLTVVQLKSICRTASGAYSARGGAARGRKGGSAAAVNSTREELIFAIRGYAQHRCVQRTLDGKSMIANLVERVLCTAKAEQGLREKSSSQRDSQDSQDSVEDTESEEDLHLSQSQKTRLTNTLPYCVLKLTTGTVELFRRVNRLFFLKEGVDMTLLLLINMEYVRYPEYTCHSHQLVRRNTYTAGDRDGDEEMEEATKKLKGGLDRDIARVIKIQRSIGDESLCSPPPSPPTRAERTTTSYEKCLCVFASREEMLAYENALRLEAMLEGYLEKGNKAPSSSGTASFDFAVIEDIVYRIFLWLSHNASLESRDPLLMIMQQQKKHNREGKRRSSRPSVAEETAVNLVEAFYNVIAAFTGEDASSESTKVKEETMGDASEDGGVYIKREATDGDSTTNERRDGMDEMSSTFCLGEDSLRRVTRVGGIVSGEHGERQRRKRAEAVYRMVAKRPFLARFTEGWIFAAMGHHALLSFERRKRYMDVCMLLRILLSTPYCPGRRGYWWLRLVTNMEHLGKKNQALLLAELGVEDPFVRSGDRLLLQKKVLALAKPPRRWSKPSFVVPRAAGNVTIEGTLLTPGIAGKKSVFEGLDGSPCSVEELALSYYCRSPPQDDKVKDGDSEEDMRGDETEKDCDETEKESKDHDTKKATGKMKSEDGLWGWEGLHCENGIFKTLFGILMWDILFADVEGVFQTPFQDAPLDLRTDAFYTSRKDIIEKKLEEIKTRPMDELLEEAWIHEGIQCHGVNWRYDKERLKIIAQCVGGPVLAHVCKILAEDYDGWGNGLPDLLLWKAEERIAKLAEVKGPRDRLSGAQQAWIDQLLYAGMDVEVFRVKERKAPVEEDTSKKQEEEQEDESSDSQEE